MSSLFQSSQYIMCRNTHTCSVNGDIHTIMASHVPLRHPGWRLFHFSLLYSAVDQAEATKKTSNLFSYLEIHHHDNNIVTF